MSLSRKAWPVEACPRVHSTYGPGSYRASELDESLFAALPYVALLVYCMGCTFEGTYLFLLSSSRGACPLSDRSIVIYPNLLRTGSDHSTVVEESANRLASRLHMPISNCMIDAGLHAFDTSVSNTVSNPANWRVSRLGQKYIVLPLVTRHR
jgi:hypothetical protein